MFLLSKQGIACQTLSILLFSTSSFFHPTNPTKIQALTPNPNSPISYLKPLPLLLMPHLYNQAYKMPIEDFDIKEPLGKGSFGCVSKCIRKSDQQVYAMKQIKIQKLKEKDKQNALNQIRFLASIQSPYVVSYKEAFYDEKTENLCIVMEYADGGDLQGRIKKAINTRTKIPQPEIWKTAYNVLEGLNKLHESNIIHRDIKPANIFFHHNTAQLGDLNVAKHLVDQFTITQTGTPYYASPQVWNQQPYNFKSDIWSLGCVLYEMAMLKPPFRADTPNALFKKIMVGEYQKIGLPYSKELTSFIAKLMTHGQKSRPDVKELLCYPKMLDMKGGLQEEEEDELIRTIKFPPNLKVLNDKLPRPKYQSKNKTTKEIPLEASQVKSCKSTAKLPLPSLKCIPSQKTILAPHNQRVNISTNLKQSTLARKPRALIKNGSQKLIF